MDIIILLGSWVIIILIIYILLLCMFLLNECTKVLCNFPNGQFDIPGTNTEFIYILILKCSYNI